MMKLEKGMYVRTFNGKIRKILSLSFDSRWKSVFIDTHTWLKEEYIAKSRYNIIDLIEEHDIIETKFDGIVEIFKDSQGKLYYELADHIPSTKYLHEDDIIKILTHEQFENNCYKVIEN